MSGERARRFARKGNEVMPNRILRESILESRPVNSLSWPAEVFYRRLMSKVDDFGRFYADVGILRGALYARQLDKVREADVASWLQETVTAGLVRLFAANGEPYLVFLKLGEPRAKTSKFPEPPSELRRAHLLARANI